ncbi:hypothetical protein K438DRAFT_2006614 [Mycena galopus ATCC 62051]|nr:hypothetical protein K438DRAFT_2006614 [Mycena galopus ATCC 62051]
MNNTDVALSTGAAMDSGIVIFNLFAFLGLFWLSAVLITAATSRTIHRSKTWFAHLGAWAAYSLSYVLIVGRQTGPPPSHTVCLLQASLIYACPVLAGIGGLCFLIEIYLGISTVLFQKKIHPGWSTLLAIFPYLFAACVFIRVLLMVRDESTVQRHPTNFYCHIAGANNAFESAIIVLVSGILLLSLEGGIIVMLCVNWRDFRNLSRSDPRYGLSVFIRLGLFTLLYCFGAGLDAFTIYAGNMSFASWSVLLPIASIFAALAFGTQKDILQAWMFWRKPSFAEGSGTPTCRDSESFVSPVFVHAAYPNMVGGPRARRLHARRTFVLYTTL